MASPMAALAMLITFGPFSDEQPEVATILDLAALAAAFVTIAGAVYAFFRAAVAVMRWHRRWLLEDVHERLDHIESIATSTADE